MAALPLMTNMRLRACWRGAGLGKTSFGFSVLVGWQRALLQDRDVVLQVRWVRRADDRRVQLGIGGGRNDTDPDL